MASKKAYYENIDTMDCMADIETLGTTDSSVILSIGAILFNPFSDEPLVTEEGQLLAPHFYRVIHKETQIGRTINRDTEEWWSKPERAEAWKQIEEYPDKVHLVSAMSDLWDFMSGKETGHKVLKGWGCAPSFDQKILGNAMAGTGVKRLKGSSMDLPIAFYNEMDVRTVETFVFGRKFRSENRSGTYHNALDDCVTQALMVREAAKVVEAGRKALGIQES